MIIVGNPSTSLRVLYRQEIERDQEGKDRTRSEHFRWSMEDVCRLVRDERLRSLFVNFHHPGQPIPEWWSQMWTLRLRCMHGSHRSRRDFRLKTAPHCHVEMHRQFVVGSQHDSLKVVERKPFHLRLHMRSVARATNSHHQRW